jgi:ATP-binding cassette subfamily B (MDR/TAP) protein 1
LKRSSSASGRTTIIIAHRLATVRNADRIIVMKEGNVEEEGQHEALVQANGVYAELVQAQQFEKRGEASVAPSIVSSSRSSHKEQSQSDESTEAAASAEVPLALDIPKYSAAKLISRCVKLSRNESPAIVVGLVCSILSGGIIIGEVSRYPTSLPYAEFSSSTPKHFDVRSLIILQAILFGNLVELLNDTSGTGELTSRIAFYCLLFLGLAMTALLSHGFGKTAFGIVSENLVLRVRDVSFRTILQQDIAWFSKPGHSHHALMAKINMDSGSISGLSGVILGTVFSVATSVIGGIILAHLVAWKIAIVLLAAVPVMLLAGFLRLRILAIAEEHHQTAYNDAAALASEATSSMQIVAAFGLEKHFLDGYQEAIRKPYDEHLRFSLLGNILLAFSLSVTYFVYSLAYWW